MTPHKTALVLSAGGMFAAYQAGVWKTLEQQFQPDIVVGASAGALNGWLIASGISGDALIAQWLDPAISAALRPRGWRFDPEPIRARAEHLVQTAQPRCEFGVVVVEVPHLRPRLIRYPAATAGHLRASCAIPLFLPSVKIGDRRYVDGGFLDKLPIWAAIEMGATRIIAVDCLQLLELRWLRPRRKTPLHVQVTLLKPSEPLGRLRDGVVWQQANIAHWIELGQRDAAACQEK